MAGNSEHILLLPLPRTSRVPHISCSNSEINYTIILQIGLVTHTRKPQNGLEVVFVETSI